MASEPAGYEDGTSEFAEEEDLPPPLIAKLDANKDFDEEEKAFHCGCWTLECEQDPKEEERSLAKQQELEKDNEEMNREFEESRQNNLCLMKKILRIPRSMKNGGIRWVQLSRRNKRHLVHSDEEFDFPKIYKVEDEYAEKLRDLNQGSAYDPDLDEEEEEQAKKTGEEKFIERLSWTIPRGLC